MNRAHVESPGQDTDEATFFHKLLFGKLAVSFIDEEN